MGKRRMRKRETGKKDLEDIIEGTVHPNPITRGMNDFPCKPILCIILSIIKATLAIYPESSINEIKKYNINILGKNTITPPTPPIIPSTTKSCNIPSGKILENEIGRVHV